MAQLEFLIGVAIVDGLLLALIQGLTIVGIIARNWRK
ncbi:hypothetical protein LCGC14_1771910 [marine sediment metagenome]|uniref:Uncharacterized protein n=1 Tax=marine sediment metagenome TaxID=412755 RepID=A0A0F9GY14_9ZZZZ